MMSLFATVCEAVLTRACGGSELSNGLLRRQFNGQCAGFFVVPEIALSSRFGCKPDSDSSLRYPGIGLGRAIRLFIVVLASIMATLVREPVVAPNKVVEHDRSCGRNVD